MNSSATFFKGNKNKMGQTLGRSMRTAYYTKSTSDSMENVPHTQEHASLVFSGNKNGTGSKLGNMPHTNTIIHEQMVASHTDDIVEENIPLFIGECQHLPSRKVQ